MFQTSNKFDLVCVIFSDDFLINNIIKDTKYYGCSRRLLQRPRKLLLHLVLCHWRQPLRSCHAASSRDLGFHPEQSHRGLLMGGSRVVIATHRLCRAFIVLSSALRPCCPLSQTVDHVRVYLFMGSEIDIQFLQKRRIHLSRRRLSMGLHSQKLSQNLGIVT